MDNYLFSKPLGLKAGGAHSH